MNLLMCTVKQEKKRIEVMLQKYKEAYAAMPKGTLSAKKSGNKVYYYLKFRDGKKVVSKYVKDTELEDMMEQLEHKKHLETMIKFLKEELAMADSVLEGKKK